MIKGYYVGYKPSDSDTYIYKTLEVNDKFMGETYLKNLNRSTKYQIVVQAFNSKGIFNKNMFTYWNFLLNFKKCFLNFKSDLKFQFILFLICLGAGPPSESIHAKTFREGNFQFLFKADYF